uniref:Aurein-1.1 n=1 Tax=Ranoidea raniformis TaxID=116057 RepID=AUR11_RANRN|nr:RecName: Full=Aurein-1.1 [Ranoidea raniformis]
GLFDIIKKIAESI